MTIFPRGAGIAARGRAASSSILDRIGLVGWFNAREPRERALILICGALLLSYLGVFWLWQPLSAMRADALADIAKFEAVTARVTAAGSDLALASAGTADLPDATVITESATAVGLDITRLEPEGERTRIEVENADFTVLIDWLALLDGEHALQVATIEIDRRPEPGIVSARIAMVK